MRPILFILTGIFLIMGFSAMSQSNPMSRFRGGGGRGGDTVLKHRVEDTITINYRYLDSSRLRKLDSSIVDFVKVYPLPNTFIDLGNLGTPSRNLVFTPSMKPGWDAGWHAWDPFIFTVDQTRFYTTTKPYTELGYLIGSHAEQMINLVHTQNIKPNWNALFEYRLINAPGNFNNQNTNHNTYRFSTWYQSRNKRYQAFVVLLGSKLQASENGGIRSSLFLDSIGFENSNIPTKLGGPRGENTNPFGIQITTGTLYTTAAYVLRQQYDLIGIKDSVVTDSTVTPLFYPKFRIEQTTSYNTYHYRYIDYNPDTLYYVQNLNFISTPDTLRLGDTWKSLTNDFSLYQFPDGKNPQQFFKAGVAIQNISGSFDAGSRTLYNLFIHGEYRNKTRNQKWDIEAQGNFYLSGYNAGDYNAYIDLKRFISRKIGYLEAGFQDVNKTVPVAWDQQSSFGFGVPGFFNKENVINIFGFIDQPRYRFRLGANYYLLTNYPYFHDYYIAAQESNPFNILQVSADKVITLYRHWILRASLVVQQRAGNAPVNLPLIVTNGQLGYEGKLGFKNLQVAFGMEFRYFSPYKADGYSPPVGQFFTQNSETIKENLPDLTLYINLRIRSFTAYLRGENLNSFQLGGANGSGFHNYNFVAPAYPYPGLRLRLGIYWSFVN
jgi:hypothetical protein